MEKALQDNVLPLITAGNSEYVIVRSENAGADEILASEEMQKYLCQITGVTLPIVTDSTPAGECEIVIGQTNREAEGQFNRAELTRDGFIIKTDGGKLWLVGGSESGALFAVYEFLEGWLGCRFYTNDFEKIPHLESIELPAKEDKQIPVLDIRYHNWFSYRGPIFRKLKMRTPRWAGGSCHTLPGLAETGNGMSPDPCLQSEEVYRTVLKNVRALLAANPEAECISVSQCDVDSYCQCDACRAFIQKHGISGNYLQFVNRIADAIRDEYPHVKVHTFAYTRCFDPPISDMRAADNVMVQFCTLDNCFSHPLSECDAEASGRTGKDTLPTGKNMQKWGKICKYLAVWDYTTNFWNPSLLFPNFDVLWKNMEFFVRNNARYVFEQGTHEAIRAGEYDDLKAYLQARLLWDPYMGEEKYYAWMDEFLADYYGPGWKHIRKFIDHAEKVSEALHFNWAVEVLEMLQVTCEERERKFPYLPIEALRNYKETDWTPYYDWYTTITHNDLAETGVAAFAAAEEEAVTEEQRYRIEESSFQVKTMMGCLLEIRYTWQIVPALEKIFAGNLQVKVKESAMGQEEAERLKAAFDADILEPLRKIHVDYLHALAERMIAHKVTLAYMGMPVSLYLTGEANFWNPEWKDPIEVKTIRKYWQEA